MDKFIAIPVGQGDSFYLLRNDFSILIDGGLSRSGFPGMFDLYAKTDRVNIVVCTHNDADHANGLLGFLETGHGCDEVWLPGRWLDALPNILKPILDVYLELVINILNDPPDQSTDGINTRSSLLEKYSQREVAPQSDAGKQNENNIIGNDGWPVSLGDALEQVESWDAKVLPLIYNDTLHEYLDNSQISILMDAIDAADRIRKIATTAYHRGIPVRWFEYDVTSLPAGGNIFLEPLNARAVARIKPIASTLLFHLSLTVSNKESLVFWSPPTDHAPGVLFNADSDLANVTLPTTALNNALATSPHHGSDANANAYTSVSNAAGASSNTIRWVRSDCRSKSRPGKTYLGLPSSNRVCTMCRLSTGVYTLKTEVSFTSSSGLWKSSSTTSTNCHCK